LGDAILLVLLPKWSMELDHIGGVNDNANESDELDSPAIPQQHARTENKKR